MKLAAFLSISVLLASNAFALDKPKYLSPYEPIGGASPKVLDFIEGRGYSSSAVQSVPGHYDALGRLLSTRDSTYYVPAPLKEKMDVLVLYRDFPKEYEGEPVHARYVFENGEKKYWLNGSEISEEVYFDKIKKDDEYSPVGYIASLTADEIKSLLLGARTVYIEELPKSEGAIGYARILDTTLVTTYAHNNGYKGSGIGIYTADDGCARLASINASNYQMLTCSGVSVHATAMTNVMQAAAPEATIYGRNEYGFVPDPSSVSPRMEIGMVARSITNALDNEYSAYDEFLDNYVYQNGLSVFVSAGNQTDENGSFYVTSPGKALNVITVGAVLPFSNQYAAYSCWKNSAIRNQKPEIATYTNFTFPSYGVGFIDSTGHQYTGFVNGTSGATAFAAGMFAALLQQHPFFKQHAEMAKALLITGSTKLIAGARTFDRDNISVAAEAMPVYRNLGWNTRSAYWNGGNSCCFVGDSISFMESGIVAGKRYRIAIAWLTLGTQPALHGTLAQDLDLFVYQGNRLVDSSTSANNPFEGVDIVASTNENLRIKIVRYANTGTGNTKIGYNMWIDN